MVNYLRRRRNKRWYIDASAKFAPKVPYVGGSGIRIAAGNKTRRGLPISTVKRIARREALKTEETKQTVITYPRTSMYHATVYSSVLNFIETGANADQKTGDRVFYCGFNIRLLIHNVSTLNPHPPTWWRIMVVKLRDKYPTVTANAFNGSTGVGASTLFRNSNVTPIGLINTDNCDVMCSRIVKFVPDYTGQVMKNVIKMNCKLMKPFQFRTGSFSEGEYYNHYLVVIPHLDGGTAGATFVGDVDTVVEQVFKDA